MDDDVEVDLVPPRARRILDRAWAVVGWCYFGTGVSGHLVVLAAIVLSTWVVLPPWLTVLPLAAWAALTWWGVRLYRKAPGAVIVLFFADLAVLFAFLALVDAVGDIRP